LDSETEFSTTHERGDPNKSSGEETSSSMQILEMIDSGRISAEDGLRLLRALSGGEGAEEAPQAANEVAIPLEPPAPEPAIPEPIAPVVEEPLAFAEPEPPFEQEPAVAGPVIQPAATAQASPGTADRPAPASPPPDVRKWGRWWMIPLWIGLAISVFGGIFISLALRAHPGFSLWLLCATIPFTLGVVVMVLAWLSRQSPWLHLRVQQAPGETPQRITFSMPLPLGIMAWFFRNFGHYIKGVQDFPVEDMIMAVGQTATAENPIYIQVDEGENGEKVEIFIG
jgi:SHOCT-like domain